MLYRIVDRGITVLLKENPESLTVSYQNMIPILSDLANRVPFDPSWYMKLYSDVEPQIKSGKYADAEDHFRRTGFLVGRCGAPMPVDSVYYLEIYKDIKLAVQESRVESAQEHFRWHGFFEGRAASQRHSVDDPWYLDHYPSSTHEIDHGLYMNAQDHYNRMGYSLGYAANALAIQDC